MTPIEIIALCHLLSRSNASLLPDGTHLHAAHRPSWVPGRGMCPFHEDRNGRGGLPWTSGPFPSRMGLGHWRVDHSHRWGRGRLHDLEWTKMKGGWKWWRVCGTMSSKRRGAKSQEFAVFDIFRSCILHSTFPIPLATLYQCLSKIDLLLGMGVWEMLTEKQIQNAP